MEVNMNLRRLFITLVTISISPILFGQAGKPENKENNLRAGLSKIDITPSIPVKLYGYSSRKSYSEGVHDSLYARAVVFENDGRKLVMISTDVGSFGAEVSPVIRKNIIEKFNLKESELFLTAIHSHSAPVLSVNRETGDPSNISYTELLNQKLLALVDEAFKNMVPVHTGIGAGSSPVGSNRREMSSDGSIILGRNPYGPTDKEVLVMKLQNSDGKPVGAIYDYATHATSLGPQNLMISGDVLGISAQFVEKILGNNVISPIFAGASGNIDPWYRVLPGFNSEPGWIPETVLLGTLLGEETVTVFRNIKETKPGGKISTLMETIDCSRKKSTDNVKSTPENDPPAIPVNIIAARIGDVAFVGFNVEMLTEVGMAIKAGSPFKYTFVITHCNGYSGYLPPAHLYKEGGYEVNSSPFEIGSAEIVVKRALRMLYDLE
jgi:hypothetical protein